jgi:hypothetical protein
LKMNAADRRRLGNRQQLEVSRITGVLPMPGQKVGGMLTLYPHKASRSIKAYGSFRYFYSRKQQ